MLKAVYPIVEGHGEVPSMPILLRRFAREEFQNFQVKIFPPHRIPKGRMLAEADKHLERAVELGARRIIGSGGPGAIFLLLDADEGCPAQLGPALLARMRVARADMFSAAVVAKSEYESWFLAAVRSLRGHCNVRTTAEPPAQPEEIRDAKGYIQQNFLEPGRHYSEVLDQPAMTSRFSFAEAATCGSFQKLRRDLAAAFAL